MNDKVIEKVEQLLNTKVVSEEIVSNNPIFSLMRRSAKDFFDKDFSKSSMEFHFYYVLDYRINAYTLKFDNHAVICFTTGAIEQIFHIFDQMSEFDEFQALFGTQDFTKLTADLGVYSLFFLFFHEYGHLICGHIGYIAATKNIAFMALFEHISEHFILDRQAFEVQADVVAAGHFSFIVRDNGQEFNLTRLKIVFAAVYTLFEIMYLFDRGRFSTDSLYLPSTYRMTTAFAIMIKDHVEEAQPVLEQVIDAAEKGFYHIFRLKNQKMQQLKKKSSKIDKYMDTIAEHWNNLYHELEPFSFVKLSPDIYEWSYNRKD